jgi:hypothetical protein
MRRGRAPIVLAITLLALTASCRAIFGIDDFAGGSDDGGGGGSEASLADGATAGDAIAAGDALADGATNPTDGGLDATLPLVATDACAGCFVVGELDTATSFDAIFIGTNADTICWTDSALTVRCRARAGGPTAEYVYDSGAGPLQAAITNIAVGDTAAGFIEGTHFVGLTLDGGEFHIMSAGYANGLAALPGDLALVAVAPETNSEEGGVVHIFPMTTTSAGVAVSVTTSMGSLATIPGRTSFYGGSFGAKTLLGIQQCTGTSGSWMCSAQLPTAANPNSVTTSSDGSVGYVSPDGVHFEDASIGDEAGISNALTTVFSREQMVFVADDGDGGSELAAWTPGAATFTVLVPALGRKPYAVPLAGDDSAVFFVIYSGGLHATIVEMKR